MPHSEFQVHTYALAKKRRKPKRLLSTPLLAVTVDAATMKQIRHGARVQKG